MGSRRFLALSRGPHLFAGVSGQKEELGCERDAPEIGSIPPASLPSMGVQKGGGPGPRIPTTPDPLPEPGGAERPDPGRQRGYKGLLLSSGTQNSGGARWGWAWAPRPCRRASLLHPLFLPTSPAPSPPPPPFSLTPFLLKVNCNFFLSALIWISHISLEKDLAGAKAGWRRNP